MQINSQRLGLASSGQGFFPSNVPARRHSGHRIIGEQLARHGCLSRRLNPSKRFDLLTP
jgi:hypothetical protein